ncbi:hypothetical protein IWQ60_007899 [Tieghemiomyces parasiticus]|uniref:SHSP domain-containing protein n=1 Tax=Tieghemiomyces parasiticus TaxID=78921 RepID=A0A9W8A480_9FUNG|nr:hypothetical protein IWQ60_007899 [Tieghemiomyces parasiticus]
MVISERVWDTTVEGDPAANPMHLGTSEIKETPDHFYVKVDWHKHGVAPNRVAGHHEGRDLVIRCEHEAGSQLKEVVTYVKTDHADVLERRVRIPENVDLTKYEEHYKNGEFWAKYSKVKEPIFHTWKC